MTPRANPWLVRAIGAALVVLTLATTLSAQRDVGVARDETVYMGAGDGYARWWLDLIGRKRGVTSHAGITAAFGGPGVTDHNREHPPLMKTLFGLSHRLLHDRLGVASHVTAYRAPTALMHALLVLIVFAWVAAAWGLAEAVLAALLTLCLPRAFFHAGLAAFDGPIATLWLATLYCYWRALARWWWAIVAGVVWGLALSTKHNALLIPFAIAPHFVWVVARQTYPTTRPGRLRWPRALARGLGARWYVPLALIVLGPLTLVAVWPWLWFDTVAHVRAWLTFHMTHVHYNFEYLGHNWNHPPFPWHTAIVTTLLTVPAGTLAAAALGAAVRARWWRARAIATTDAGLLLGLSLAASMGPFLLGSTPIFGAEKHWEAAIPSLCVAAGLGAVWAARAAAAALAELWPRARHRAAPALAVALVGAALVGAAAAETAHAHPYALTSYNAIAGGAPGGADLGMNRQFWGYAARGVLPFLRTQAPPPGARPRPVYAHDAAPAWGAYARDGLLAPGLPDAGHEDAGVAWSQLAIVIHERHFRRHDFMIWQSYGTVQPVFVLRVDGVPIVSVYRRPP
ncbi:MAG: glycosyltransferase family 39 protein [Myxococcales bacterium]|nr:glycosyltransferase family 39 protein [Myxococcales bacterium]